MLIGPPKRGAPDCLEIDPFRSGARMFCIDEVDWFNASEGRTSSHDWDMVTSAAAFAAPLTGLGGAAGVGFAAEFNSASS